MKFIINFFKSLFTTKKEEFFCETIKKEADREDKIDRKPIEPKTKKIVEGESKIKKPRKKKSE